MPTRQAVFKSLMVIRTVHTHVFILFPVLFGNASTEGGRRWSFEDVVIIPAGTAIIMCILYLTMAVCGEFELPYGKMESSSKHSQYILH